MFHWSHWFNFFSIFFLDSLVKYGLEAYKFILPNSTYNRTEPDCYVSRPALVDGLSDVSKCYYSKSRDVERPYRLLRTASYRFSDGR